MKQGLSREQNGKKNQDFSFRAHKGQGINNRLRSGV